LAQLFQHFIGFNLLRLLEFCKSFEQRNQLFQIKLLTTDLKLILDQPNKRICILFGHPFTAQTDFGSKIAQSIESIIFVHGDIAGQQD
jgi:hypothetical protein